MADVVYAEGFIEDFMRVALQSKCNEIMNSIDLLASFPEIGSSRIPRSIARAYDGNVRKLVVDPYTLEVWQPIPNKPCSVFNSIHHSLK